MYGNDENILSQHVMSKGFLQTYFWGDDNKRFNTTIKLSKNTARKIFFIMSVNLNSCKSKKELYITSCTYDYVAFNRPWRILLR